jgi:hypothetical protein
MRAAVTERVGEISLEHAPEALRFAIGNPTEVMKVVIRGE